MKQNRFVCVVLIYALLLGFFIRVAPAQNNTAQKPFGLDFRVTELEGQTPKIETPKVPEALKLSTSETNAILRRLPPIETESTDEKAFALRPSTQPLPKTGKIIPVKFPPDEQQTAPLANTSAPLAVERFSPEGKASLVSDLTVTFSQPMIAVTSQSEASQTVPVKLTPEVKGRWRWLGTTTLVFDAETRFPMATVFSAVIPKGTKSAVGGALEKDFSWTFATPPPVIEKFVPQTGQGDIYPPYVIMAAKFNQEIDERAILPKIHVYAAGKELPIRLVTAEVDPSYTAYQYLDNPKPKTWLAFRSVELLPQNTDVKVVFEKGLPSAEGAGVSETEQTFSFKTLENFKLLETYCGYEPNPKECAPSADFRLRFNRSLSRIKLEEFVKIEPEIENATIELDGSASNLYVRGIKKPNTVYKITLSGEATDIYNQKIGQDISVDFKVGTEAVKFFAPVSDFMTLDPEAKPVFSIYSRNQPSFKVRLYAVTPDDYLSYRLLLREYYNNQQVAPTPKFGRQIFDKTVETGATTDAFIETRIDLSEAFAPGGFGHAVLIAEPTVKTDRRDDRNKPFVIWIQSTNIGVDMLHDYEKMTAFATELKTGKPLAGAEVSLRYDKTNALNSITDGAGLAEFTLPVYSGRPFLLVRQGADSAILRQFQDFYEYYSFWAKQTPYDANRWFVFDDRQIYRPNEEVSVKGYVRGVTGGKFSDITEFGGKAKTLNYVLKDARYTEIMRGSAQINAFGAFDFKIRLPENINLGYERLEFWLGEISGSPEFAHVFQAQEFRRPEFEVTVAAETPAPYFVGNSAIFSGEAKYYTGGFLANSDVNWRVYAAVTNYSPPNHEDFTFGSFVPWWRNYSDWSSRNYYAPQTQYAGGTTGADGKHRIKLDFMSANPARPYNLTATAEVQDVNRQTIADTKSFLVHPAEVYVGLRTAKTFVRQNERLTVEAIATDIDGKTVLGAPIEIKAVLKDWMRAAGSWQEVTIDTQTCRTASAEKPISCDFTAKQGGTFIITATVLDAKERPNTSELTVWVAGANLPPKRNVEMEEAELIPDKKEYSPGERAEILVNTPFFPAEGVMTLERAGIVKTERFSMSEASTVLQIPIEERFLPNIHVKVDLVGASQRTDDKGEIDTSLPPRPAYASGELNLNVSTASRKLNVSVEPFAKVTEPGKEAKINIDVKDSAGNAAPDTEVALVAVDEGVLALTDYKIQNPLDVFYQQIASGVSHYHSREKVVLGNPKSDSDLAAIKNQVLTDSDSNVLAMRSAESVMVLDGSQRRVKAEAKRDYKNWLKKDVSYIITENEKAKLNIRRNFDALAIFSPSVKTDANGKATVAVKLPDNLTRYRITAVAVTKSKQFGRGESSLTARQTLQVRPSAPRFMNFTDRAELPVVLQNQSDAPLTIDVAIRAANARLTDGNGRRITIPANERAEIRFPIAVEKAGVARFQIGAVAGSWTDAAEFAFPVYTPATTEAFATYGTTDSAGAIIQPIDAPTDVYPQFGGLEVTTSSTQLQELTDAFFYIYGYPFGCTEQVSSRILSIAALRDVLQAFNAKDMPKAEEIDETMTAGIERLKQLQHYDGGFSFWLATDESIPYVSVHVSHAIARAKAKGYKVPDEMVSRALNYLTNIESKYPKEYSEESRRAISAYALYVRNLLGDNASFKAKKLINDAGLDKLSAESIGWLLSVLVDDKESAGEVEVIKRHLLNRATETAGAAHFVTNYRDGEYVLLSSERRADAVILEAFLKAEPNNGLIPKIVRGLLANRVKGRWRSTQENIFVLLALDKYFQTYEKVTPNFVAKIWFGNSFAGAQKFAGRSVDSNSINIPMSYLQNSKSTQNLILDKQGEGRLYYRIGTTYAPKNLNIGAADYGFAVSRSYEAMDNETDVQQNPDGSWTIKSGARVRVRLKMIAPTRRYHVALVDNLPAGLEIINPGLATSGNIDIYDRSENRRSYWVQHQNFRDNRAEAFTMLLWEGAWDYSYIARATTPGDFVAPPAKAEEMYAPETFGRSHTDFVKVK